MWPVFSQLHVYALAWPCFRAAPRSRPAFLPQTDDGSPAVSPVGPVGWPCAKPSQAGDGVPASCWAAIAPCRARRHRRGRWIARAVSRLRILDPSSTAWMIESRGDGRRERRAAAWIARRGVGSAGGGPGARLARRRLPARPGPPRRRRFARPGAFAPLRPVAFAPPRRVALEDFEFSGRDSAGGRGSSAGGGAAHLAGRRRGGRRHGSPGGAAARRAARSSPGGARVRRAAAKLGGRARERRAAARLARRGGGAAGGAAARGAGRRRSVLRPGSPHGVEARLAAARLARGAEAQQADRTAGAAGGGVARGAPRWRDAASIRDH
eukprot:tig00021358_g20807.t1